jgi:zinc protease
VYRHDNPYPRGHFRYIETLEEQITGVKGATVEAVKAFYSDFYGGSYAELTAVGEIEPEQFRLLAQNAFGDWVTPRPYARIPAPYHAITPLQSTIDVADKSNAIYYARMPLPISDTDPDYPALLLGNYLFGGSNDSRLFNRVRQKEGLSYSVGSSFNVNSFDPNSDFSIYAIYAPQNRARLGDALRDEFARVLREGVTPAEVARAKSAIEQERRLSLMQDAPLAATLALYLRLGRTMAFVEQTDRAIAGLTPPQIQSVLRKYLRPDAMAAVYAGAFAAPPK